MSRQNLSAGSKDTEPTGLEDSHEPAGFTGAEHVLLLGTFAGAGIQQYIEGQADRLTSHVHVSTYDMVTPPHGSGVVWFLRGFLAATWAACKFPFRRPPDIAHVHASHDFSFFRATFYVLFVAKVWRRPVVLHIHGSGFDEFVRTTSRPVAALQSAVFDACDRIVVLSPYWQEVLHEEAGVPTSKLVVLPNAVEPQRYEPEFDVDPPRIVFVSTLVPRKGVPELIEAIDELADRATFEATIAGDGPLAPEVRALANRHDAVDAPGYVDEQTKRRLLSEGSIYVLPSHAEGLPIAMLEGMAGGNAVVATTVGGIPDVIGPTNGVLVPPGDVEALEVALESLLETQDRARSMGHRNRELVEDEYDWSSVTTILLDMYGELLD